MNPRVVRYPNHRHKPLYDVPLSRHLMSGLVALGIALSCMTLLLHFADPQNAFDINRVAFREIALGTLNTLCRMTLAFFLALVVAVPLALAIASTPRTQRILLPIVDVFQSIPVLAFFPVVAVFFVTHHAFELAAVFVIFLSMLWNIVFPVIGGLQTIPDDVHSAALVFKVRGWNRFRYITLPALFPFMVTGSLLAWAQGWTIVIVAEVLHTYIPNGTTAQDLLGLGSLLVDSNTTGKTSLFLAALTAMILLITALNLALWQPLLSLSRRFRFD